MKFLSLVKGNNTTASSYVVRIKVAEKILLENGFKKTKVSFLSKPDLVLASKIFSIKGMLYLSFYKALGAKIVFDICDNYLLRGAKYTFRFFLLRAIVDKWVFSSIELRKAINNEIKIKNGIVIGELPSYGDNLYCDINYFDKIKYCRLKLVWFGNSKVDFASGGMSDLLLLNDFFTRVDCIDDKSVLTVISNDYSRFLEIEKKLNFPGKLIYLDFDSDSFETSLHCNDVALIPIKLNDFTRCKTSTRVTVALRNNLAVLGTFIPSYFPASRFAVFDDWSASGLERSLNLRSHPDLHAFFRLESENIEASWRSVFEL